MFGIVLALGHFPLQLIHARKQIVGCSGEPRNAIRCTDHRIIVTAVLRQAHQQTNKHQHKRAIVNCFHLIITHILLINAHKSFVTKGLTFYFIKSRKRYDYLSHVHYLCRKLYSLAEKPLSELTGANLLMT